MTLLQNGDNALLLLEVDWLTFSELGFLVTVSLVLCKRLTFGGQVNIEQYCYCIVSNFKLA